jgi:ATP-dependent Clp protease ATP-binding subunit ClpB
MAASNREHQRFSQHARLSELSRRVLNGAEQIAAQMHHPQVGLAHLLFALTHERRSVCAQLLREARLDEKRLEANLIKPHPTTGGSLKDIIDRAVDCAEKFGSHYTGTDHLLLTIATDPRGVRLLRKYNASTQYLIEKLSSILSK